MGGAAEKWRLGRGRRPGWGTHAGGVDPGASGGRGPGGSGGPGGGRRAAAAAPSAPPVVSGLGLRLSGPDACRSSLRLCCSSSWRRRRRRRRRSCFHSPHPRPGRRQLRTRPRPRLHPRGGVARPRRAGRAGRQRGYSSQARAGCSRPYRRQPRSAAATADSALTLMLRGAPALGGASLPTPSPSHRGPWPGRPPPRRPGFMWWPRHHRYPARHKSRERPAGRSLPTPRASLPGEPPAAARVPPCWAARALRATRGALGRTRRFGVQRLSGRLHCERLERCFLRAEFLFPTCLPPPQLAGLSSAESCCSGFLKLFKLFLQLGIYIFLNSGV